MSEPDFPDCLWCGELISGDQVRVDRWYLHPGCDDALRQAVSEATSINVEREGQ